MEMESTPIIARLKISRPQLCVDGNDADEGLCVFSAVRLAWAKTNRVPQATP
ncbi:hypothetical protein CEV32_4024 [Brucella rhizosphaerae]|uniref:Uncharacterized protein n=1 Tax=Brucella rhizosphaerae TaxID=571254 RepID=A0A256FQU9_9HYPH|nr:hypothetical protein CEV32_4024 [Brucella rhizosphaerae]